MTCLAPNNQCASCGSVRQTILLAEPDLNIREAITLALEGEGFCVVQIADGLKVLQRLTAPASEQAIDLLILEATLPQMSGLHLCQLLRRQGHNLPILLISTKASETDRVLGLEIGADDYLVKPFSIRELVARCRALMRQ